MDKIPGIIELTKLAKNNFFNKEEVENLRRKLRMLTSSRADVQFELERIELSSNKKRKTAVANWLEDVDTVANKVQRLEAEMSESRLRWNVQWQGRIGNLIKEVDELNGHTFGGELVHESCGSERVPFVVSRLVGQAFEAKKTKIWEWMMSDEVLSVGIYGMGGIGKTTLMMHIYNQIMEERPEKFNNIYWITVSQDFSVYKLQDQVANAIKFDFCGENDEKMRAARLSDALKKRQKSVLILDDLWNQFSPEDVGLPLNLSACKLILTTRSLDVCRMMRCQQKMKLNSLLEEESWCLFTETLGNYAALPFEAKPVAKMVARECAGLPLGLVTLAGSMRGVHDIIEWRSVLEQLRTSSIGTNEMEEKVFKVLNLSYDRLRDPALQKCFLYCALFPEDYKIPRWELIQYVINDDETMNDLTSRKAQVERSHVLLNRLENACLLQACLDSESHSCVKMHDLVRDIAIRNNPKAMVEVGKQLKELPFASRWPGDLARASFMDNNIMNVPGGHSPSCSELSCLLLCRNFGLEDIADCFFTRMRGLKILDLSETSISILPSSISNLVSLTTLLLRKCYQLRYIPSLAMLTTLQELDLYGCNKLEQVPAGLEFLSNLRYLDLDKTKIKDLPDGLLSDILLNLEYLGLPFCLSLSERLACYGKVDYLSCRVRNPHEIFGMMRDHAERPPPSNYWLMVGGYGWIAEIAMLRYKPLKEIKKVVLFQEWDMGEGGELFVAPATGIDALGIFSCHSLRSLDNFLCVNDERARHRLVELFDCNNLDCLISPSCLPGRSNMVNHVTNLSLECLSNLRSLIHRDQASLSSGALSCLRVFRIVDCPKICSLFPLELLSNLHNLEELTVAMCNGMEEIIAVSRIEGPADGSLLVGEASSSSLSGNDGNAAAFISFPKLRIFDLWKLPKLKRICRRQMRCGSLEIIDLYGCPRLERIPISLVQLRNGRPSPLPSLKEIRIGPPGEGKEWWDSVELDSQHPCAKDVLQPFLKNW